MVAIEVNQQHQNCLKLLASTAASGPSMSERSSLRSVGRLFSLSERRPQAQPGNRLSAEDEAGDLSRVSTDLDAQRVTSKAPDVTNRLDQVRAE